MEDGRKKRKKGEKTLYYNKRMESFEKKTTLEMAVEEMLRKELKEDSGYNERGFLDKYDNNET